ncbi:histidine phosphatase [Cyathus striatus]|nr:histidine phosphatase [Cyathus striatus]
MSTFLNLNDTRVRSVDYFTQAPWNDIEGQDVPYYPPKATNINNLTFVINGTGAPGIFNSSTTPKEIYGLYNWCNMPHTRSSEYKTPAKEYKLQYVEIIQRHHKRTPYSSNTFFREDVTWSCEGQGPLYGAQSSTGQGKDTEAVHWQAYSDPLNPWTNTIGPGFVNSTCQFPQITSEGLEDSITHGTDLRNVYASRLGLTSKFDPSKVHIRVTNNEITSQVASGLLKGLFPSTPSSNIEVQIQSSTFDSLEPTYSCPNANNLKSGFTTGSKGQIWQDHLNAAKSIYASLDAVSGIDPNDGGWHASFDHYYDNLSAKLCHSKSLPCSVNDTSLCVSESMAETVFRLGNWEYSYLYRDAPDTAAYSALRYGAWVLEMRGRLQLWVDGKGDVKYYHNVHRARWINIPLLGFLQVDVMVAFELYQKDNTQDHFLRVLWGGQPMETSTPLGVLDMIPIDDFFKYIDSMVGSASSLYSVCTQ